MRYSGGYIFANIFHLVSRHDKERPGKELDYLQQVDHCQLNLQTLHFIVEEFSGSCFFGGPKRKKRRSNYAYFSKLCSSFKIKIPFVWKRLNFIMKKCVQNKVSRVLRYVYWTNRIKRRILASSTHIPICCCLTKVWYYCCCYY